MSAADISAADIFRRMFAYHRYIHIGQYVTQYTHKTNLGAVLIINSQQSLMFQCTDIILDNAPSSLTEIYDMIHIFIHISVTIDI